jgi:hypothetical protein
MTSVNHPPRSGPATDEIARTPPMIPMYLGRSRKGTTSAMIVCERIIMPLPPTPWMNRPAISQPIESASPAMVEPARKMTIAPRKSPLRPIRSPSRP